MLRSTTIIRELQLSLAKVMLILKHSVRLHRNLLCGGVATCPGMACVLCAVLRTAHNTHAIFLVFMYLLAVCCFLHDAIIGIGSADPGILSVLWYFVFSVYFGSIIFLDIICCLNVR